MSRTVAMESAIESAYTDGEPVSGGVVEFPELVLIECECGFIGTPESGMVHVFGTTLCCPDCRRNTAQVVYDEHEQRPDVPSGLLFDDEDDE